MQNLWHIDRDSHECVKAGGAGEHVGELRSNSKS